MDTVLLVVLIVGAAVFLTKRPKGAGPSKTGQTVEPVRPETKATAFAAGGADAKGEPASATKLRPNGISRAVGPRLTVEQCRELARIHRQNMLNRQHDSRMSAAAAVAGAVAGAALMRHHDAEAQQARLDQMAAAQRLQQQSEADSYDTEDAADYGDYGDYGDDYTADDADERADGADDYDVDDADDNGFRDDDVDWDADWSVDDEEDHGDDASDYDDYGNYGNDDYSSYSDYSGADHDDDYGDYGGYGGDDYGGYDGGDYGGGDDYSGDDGGF